jgi:hypothetical protein
MPPSNTDGSQPNYASKFGLVFVHEDILRRASAGRAWQFDGRKTLVSLVHKRVGEISAYWSKVRYPNLSGKQTISIVLDALEMQSLRTFECCLGPCIELLPGSFQGLAVTFKLRRGISFNDFSQMEFCAISPFCDPSSFKYCSAIIFRSVWFQGALHSLLENK